MALQVQLDPYVAMSILDHHMRRGPEESRAVGLLLGRVVKNTVLVRNFVPTVDPNLVVLTQRASPEDLGVGWYATGLAEGDEDAAMTAKVSGAANANTFVFLHCQLPTEADVGISFRAFVQAKLTLSSREECTCFRSIPCNVVSLDNASNVLLDTFVHQLYPDVATASDPARLPATTPGTEVFAELQQISKNLGTAKAYVKDVIAKKRPGDAATGRALTDALTGGAPGLGGVTEAELQAAAGEKMKDVLMLQYLAKMLHKQLATLEAAAEAAAAANPMPAAPAAAAADDE